MDEIDYFGLRSNLNNSEKNDNQISTENVSKPAVDFISFLRGQLNSNLHLNSYTSRINHSTRKNPTLFRFKNLTKEEIAAILFKCVISIQDNVVLLNKPNGISVEGSSDKCFSIMDLIPHLSKLMNLKEDLRIVHRLDKDTTGALLLAKNHDVAFLLKDAFKRRQIRKNYICLTHGVPYPKEGIIDFPFKQTNVDSHVMITPDIKYINNRERKGNETSPVCTTYTTLCDNYNVALVQCSMLCGEKHQVRAHLAYGLDTPIIGDHKYSWFIKSQKFPIMPQILSPAALEGLKVLPTKTRYLPIHLHAHQILIDDTTVTDSTLKHMKFHAALPAFFIDSLNKLKLFDHSMLKNALKRMF